MEKNGCDSGSVTNILQCHWPEHLKMAKAANFIVVCPTILKRS